MNRQGMKYFLCTGLLMCFIHLGIQAQDTIRLSEYLATSLIDPRLDYQQEKLYFLENTNHQLPFTEELSFRTETDEFDIRRQEYLVRMDFNTKKQRKAQNALHQAHISSVSDDREQIILNNMERLYVHWAQYYIHQLEISNRKELLANLKDQFRVTGILLKTNERYDIADLVDLEDDMDDLQSEIHEMEVLSQQIQSLINQQMEQSDKELDITNFISLERIRSVMTTIPRNVESHPRNVTFRNTKAEKLAEIQVEKADQQKLLDFAQIKYSGRGENTPYGREWSLGFGLNIPVKNSGRLDVLELELETLEEQEDEATWKQRMNLRIQERYLELEAYLKQYDYLTEQLDNLKKNYSIEHYSKTGTDPMVLLQIKESQIKRKRAILNVENDIYMTYIELLGLTGQMVELPFVNYLSEQLENF